MHALSRTTRSVRPRRGGLFREFRGPEWLLGVCLAALLGLLVPACGRSDGRAERRAGPMRVVVTLAPLAGLVRPLLPTDAEVTILVPPGRSEHGYEPTVSDAAALADADLAVLVGMGLEGPVDSYLRRYPRPYRHEARLGVLLGLEDPHGLHHHDDHDHEHGDGTDRHGHAHGPVDPHVWLDPVLVRDALPEIARLVEASLSKVDPAEGARVQERLASLLARVEATDRAYRETLAPVAGRSIVTHHAAFGRLAERYGLRVVEVVRPMEGAEPAPAQIAAVIEAIRREDVRAIFVEPQFDRRGAELIAKQAGVAVGTLDPLGEGDWFEMMGANLRELVAHLGP